METIIQVDQLTDLIKLAVELGEGITNLSQDQLLDINEHLAFLTPQTLTEFMRCWYVIELYSGVIKLRVASVAEKNIMSLTLRPCTLLREKVA